MLEGRVLDCESDAPISGVVVTNGRECVATGADGTYRLPDAVEPIARNGGTSDACVYLSTPAGYRPETARGWYRNISRSSEPDLTFRLVRDDRRAGDSVAFAQLTDLHIGSYPASWIEEDIRAICADRPKIDCIVATGDMTQSAEPEQFEAYLAACRASTLPMIHQPGNHDWSADKCGGNWTRYMGPLYFSLDWGPAHIVAYESTHPHYTDNLPIDEWLAADLALTPPDRPVVFLIHHQREAEFYDRVRALTDPPRRIVMTMSGHWHSGRLYDDGQTLHFNQPSTSMGGIDYSARGYSVATVDRDGGVTLRRYLLGTADRGGMTGIDSIPDPPPVKPDPDAAPARPGASWPQFHGGPLRTGHAPDGPEPPFRRLWQTRLPGGLLFGSPVLDGDAVYIPVLDEQNPTGGAVVCADLPTGAIRWQAPTNGSVKHSVALHSDLAIAVNVIGRVTAFDTASGAERWAYQLGDPSQRWMFSAPLAVDGQVYTGHTGHFVALDAETGERLWLKDGIENWIYDKLVGTDWISSYPSPAAHGDTLYAGFFWHAEALYALDRATGETRWAVEEPRSSRGPASTPVVDPRTGAVYVLNHDAILRACDPTDGHLLWQYDLEQSDNVRGGPRWSPGTPALGPDGILYVPTGDGMLFALNTDGPERLWTWHADRSLAGVEGYARDQRSVMSSPAVSGDAVIFGASDGRILALDRRTGEPVWSDYLGAPVISSPAVSGNLLVCGASDGWLYAWTAE